MLSIKNLSLRIGKTQILNQISLKISSGKITFLLGKSGSGKTSLLRCIAQLETRWEGEIAASEKPLRSFNSKERAKTIGFVPQSYALFPHMNVLENCTGPLMHFSSMRKNEAREASYEILASLDMGLFARCYPHELSGGQQQRASIARAMLLKPRFLLLDEPTSALDPENTARLIGILESLSGKGVGLIISSQDMAFAKEAFDRAVFLENGSVAEQCDAESAHALYADSKLTYYLGSTT